MKYILEKTGKATAKEGPPLQPVNTPPPDAFTRRIWLQYFNNYLRERGTITEEEWRKMRRLIENL